MSKYHNITLAMSKEQKESLVKDAEAQNTSLNTYCKDLLFKSHSAEQANAKVNLELVVSKPIFLAIMRFVELVLDSNYRLLNVDKNTFTETTKDYNLFTEQRAIQRVIITEIIDNLLINEEIKLNVISGLEYLIEISSKETSLHEVLGYSMKEWTYSTKVKSDERIIRLIESYDIAKHCLLIDDYDHICRQLAFMR